MFADENYLNLFTRSCIDFPDSKYTKRGQQFPLLLAFFCQALLFILNSTQNIKPICQRQTELKYYFCVFFSSLGGKNQAFVFQKQVRDREKKCPQ